MDDKSFDKMRLSSQYGKGKTSATEWVNSQKEITSMRSPCIPIGDNCGSHCGTIPAGGIGTITEHCLCGECHNGTIACDIRSAYPKDVT